MEIDISLFEPTTQSMLETYPELKEFEEFKVLSPKELKFCWGISCRGSFIFQKYPGSTNEDKRKRTKAAFDFAFDDIKSSVPGISFKRKKKSVHEDLKKGIFPQKFIDAMTVFSNFSIPDRLQGLFTIEQIISNYNSMAYVTPDELADAEPGDVSKYISSMEKVSRELPKLIKMKEHQFGLKIKTKQSTHKGQNTVLVTRKNVEQ